MEDTPNSKSAPPEQPGPIESDQVPRRPSAVSRLVKTGRAVAAAVKSRAARAARAVLGLPSRALRRRRGAAVLLTPAAGPGAGLPGLTAGTINNIGVRLSNAGRTNQLIELLTALRAGLTIAVILLLFTVLGVALWKELSKKTVVIDRIDPPADLEKIGYTSPVIAKKIADHINRIKMSAETTIKSEEFMLAEASPDIEVPQANVSLKASIQYLRGLFGFNSRRVNGEVIMRGDGLHLTVRIFRDDKPTPRIYVHTVKGRLDDIDQLFGEAAQHILHYNDPYVLAAYLYTQRSDGCLAEIQYALAQEPATDDPWAYALWASILEDHKDFEGATKKYEQANEKYREVFQKEKGLVGPEFHVALNNWGNQLEMKGESLAEQGKRAEAHVMWEEALSKYRKAAEVERSYALPHVGMGDVLRKLCRYEEAVESYKHSIKLDPESPYAYIGLGDVMREGAGEFEEALAMYSVAAKLSYAPFITEEVYEKSVMSYQQWAARLEAQRRAALREQATAKLAYVYKNWGDVLRASGKAAEAIAKYRQAAELDAGLGEEVSNLIRGLRVKIRHVVPRSGLAATKPPPR